MIKAGLFIAFLGAVSQLTNCATLDSNGFVINSGKTSYVATNTETPESETEPITAFSAHVRYINNKDPLMKNTLRQNDPEAQKTYERTMDLLPVDHSDEWSPE